jgi:hypothetical protein
MTYSNVSPLRLLGSHGADPLEETILAVKAGRHADRFNAASLLNIVRSATREGFRRKPYLRQRRRTCPLSLELSVCRPLSILGELINAESALQAASGMRIRSGARTVGGTFRLLPGRFGGCKERQNSVLGVLLSGNCCYAGKINPQWITSPQ